MISGLILDQRVVTVDRSPPFKWGLYLHGICCEDISWHSLLKIKKEKKVPWVQIKAQGLFVCSLKIISKKNLASRKKTNNNKHKIKCL